MTEANIKSAAFRFLVGFASWSKVSQLAHDDAERHPQVKAVLKREGKYFLGPV